MLTKIGNVVSDWLQNAKGAVAHVAGAAAEKTAEHQRLIDERQRTIDAKAPMVDVTQGIAAEVRRLGQTWRETHGHELVALGGVLEFNGAQITGVRYGRLDEILSLDLGFVCLVFGEKLVAALGQVVEALDYPEGLPMSERAAAVDALDHQLQIVYKQHRALVDAGRAVGVTIQDLPVNRAARAREAREREQREVAALQRRAMARPGSGVSPQARLDASLELERRQRGARP